MAFSFLFFSTKSSLKTFVQTSLCENFQGEKIYSSTSQFGIVQILKIFLQKTLQKYPSIFSRLFQHKKNFAKKIIKKEILAKPPKKIFQQEHTQDPHD